MIINSDIDQDNEMKDLKPVTTIEKKGPHSDSGDWVIDSGASYHITWNQDSFIVYKQKKSWVIIINEACIESLSHNDIVIKAKNSSKMTIWLINILYMPKLDCNLVSILMLTNTKLQVNFTFKRMKIHWDKVLVTTSFVRGKLFILNLSSIISDIAFRAESAKLTILKLKLLTHNNELIHNQVDHYNIWHQQCDHQDHHNLHHLYEYVIRVNQAIRLSLEALHYDVYFKSKLVRVINRFINKQATQKLQWVYSDYLSPYWVETIGGKRYMLMFTDEFTQYSWIYLTENHKTLESCFVKWKNSVKSQSEEKLVVICTDQGSEYKGLKKKLECQSIKIKFTAVYTPEQNGISEHLNHMLVKTALALLVNAKLSHIFWGEAISHANWLQNHLPLSDINTIDSKTSHEVWFNSEKSNLHYTKVFSSLILIYMLTKTGRVKLDKKIFDDIFIDYQSGVINHWVWNSTKENVMWSLFIKVFETHRGSKLLSISALKNKWEY